MTNQQKAVRLLETEYKERLDTMAFIQACAFLQDVGNAGTFITLTDLEFRDRYLRDKFVYTAFKLSRIRTAPKTLTIKDQAPRSTIGLT